MDQFSFVPMSFPFQISRYDLYMSICQLLCKFGPIISLQLPSYIYALYASIYRFLNNIIVIGRLFISSVVTLCVRKKQSRSGLELEIFTQHCILAKLKSYYFLSV